MIDDATYKMAKEIVSLYEEQQKKQQSTICTLKNIELRRGVDGHWLSFSTLTGQHATINIENCFMKDTMVHKVVRQWAEEQKGE